MHLKTMNNKAARTISIRWMVILLYVIMSMAALIITIAVLFNILRTHLTEYHKTSIIKWSQHYAQDSVYSLMSGDMALQRSTIDQIRKNKDIIYVGIIDNYPDVHYSLKWQSRDHVMPAPPASLTTNDKPVIVRKSNGRILDIVVPVTGKQPDRDSAFFLGKLNDTGNSTYQLGAIRLGYDMAPVYALIGSIERIIALIIIAIYILCGLAYNALLKRMVVNPLLSIAKSMESDSSQQSLVIPTASACSEINKISDTYVQVISECKIAYYSLQESEDKLRMLINGAPDPIFMITNGGIILDANYSALDEFGYSRDEIIGNSISTIILNTENNKGIQDILKSSENKSYQYSGSHIRKDGSVYSADIAFTAIPHNGITEHVVTSHNITLLKEAEGVLRRSHDDLEMLVSERTKELVVAKKKSELANATKDKMIHLASHDMRAPLANIISLLELYKMQIYNRGEGDGSKLIDSSILSAQSLLNMIAQLLDIDKFRSGEYKLNKKWVNIKYIVARIVADITQLAAQKNISITIGIMDEHEVYVDVELYSRVIHNLINNAIKYCSSGDSISVYNSRQAPNVVIVEDTGAGIDDTILETIMDPEVLTSTYGTSGESGFGMGIPFVTEILEMHGGTLKIYTSKGVGTKMICILPDSGTDL